MYANSSHYLTFVSSGRKKSSQKETFKSTLKIMLHLHSGHLKVPSDLSVLWIVPDIIYNFANVGAAFRWICLVSLTSRTANMFAGLLDISKSLSTLHYTTVTLAKLNADCVSSDKWHATTHFKDLLIDFHTAQKWMESALQKNTF